MLLLNLPNNKKIERSKTPLFYFNLRINRILKMSKPTGTFTGMFTCMVASMVLIYYFLKMFSR